MFGLTRPDAPRVERIAPADAVALVAAGTAVLLDVREDEEIAQTGLADGALHVPLAAVMQVCPPDSPDHPDQMALDRPVVVYCAAGGRAGHAGEALVAMGYTRVYNLGGLTDWRAGGGKVIR